VGFTTVSQGDDLSEADLLSAFDHSSPLTAALSRTCRAWAYRMRLNVVDCDDYISESYNAIWEHRAETTFRGSLGLEIYAQKVLRRRMIDALRMARAAKRSGTLHLEDQEIFEPPAPREVNRLSPDEILEYLAELGAASQIVDRDCLSILGYVIEGYSIPEAARKIGMGSRRAQRRIQALREALSPRIPTGPATQ
jgi:RNA polymerase sigma factor (sigma-70 family)